MKRILRFLFVIILSVNYSIYGQEDTTQLNEVFLKTKYTTANELTQVFSRLKAQDLVESPQQNFTSVLQKLPGIHLQQGALNTTKINVRGIGARSQYQTNRLKMYLNSIPISTANGTSSIDDFDVLMLNGLQLFKGPKSTKYGARLGGVVVLNAEPKPLNYARTEQNFGSNNYFKQHYEANLTNKSNQYKLAYNNLSYGGFRENSNYQRESFLLTTNHKLSEEHQLKFLAHGVSLKAFIPSSLNQTDLDNSPESAAFTWRQSRGYEHYTKSVFGLTLASNWQPSFNQETAIFYNYTDAYEPRPFDILSTELAGFGARHLSEYSFTSFGLVSRFQIGAEFQSEHVSVSNFENLYEEFNRGSVEGERINQFDQNRYYVDVFSNFNVVFSDQLSLDLGLAINQTGFKQTDVLQNRKSNFNYDLSVLPKMIARYAIDSTHAIEASLSKGFSVPTLQESLTETGSFNTNLKPEEAWQYEIIYSTKPLKWLEASLTAYYIDVQNLIVARRVAEDRFVGVNAGSTNHPGLEVSLLSNFTIAEKIRLELFSNSSFNFYEFDDFVDGEDNYNGNDLTGVPQHLLNFGINASYEKLSFNLLTNAVSKLPVNDANSVYTESYVVSHLNLNYKIRLTPQIDFLVRGGIQNIFDKAYTASVVTNAVGFGGTQPRYFYPGEPRQFFGGVGLNYQF
ncbi:iron complex outermembrane recepter protein [Psychroflexus salarius]|uniref:Iron complex outermembrane recepter protein n=1 Tax=Psychroflexus salarius TaxID=1155689 RepID=A0A1M4T2L1_9FLAO|nr:TonB-dependent receptor [Psychroflexus salarius]SHE38628.1 iron complex outermembrane recepter protein [Psychroflexus salarius]